MRKAVHILGLGLAAFLATGLWLAPGASATTVEKLTTEDMAVRADRIVTGQAESTRSAWVEGTLVTLVRLKVDETWKGAPRGEITVVLPGGIDSQRQHPIQMIYPGAPQLGVGDEAVLFLEAYSLLPDTYAISGFSQGKLSIVTSPSGEKTVSRDLSGLTLTRGAATERGAKGPSSALDRLRSEVKTYLSSRPASPAVR